MRLSYAQAATVELEECPVSGHSVRLIKPGEGDETLYFQYFGEWAACKCFGINIDSVGYSNLSPLSGIS
jgi:hypothetical protein